MTTPDPVREASRRVRKYLTELGKVRGLHQEDITTLHSGDENREAALTAPDLRLLCDNADAQAALSAPPPQVPEPAGWVRADQLRLFNLSGWQGCIELSAGKSWKFDTPLYASPPPNAPRDAQPGAESGQPGG